MKIIIREIARNYPLTLLLSADPDIRKIEKYLNKGRCFGAFLKETVIGEYVLKDIKNGAAEIMNLAVDEKFKRRGVGRELIENAIERARGEGFRVLEIATGKDTMPQRFYESCGFKVYETDEGYFTRNYAEKSIEDGLEIKDQVRMRRPL